VVVAGGELHLEVLQDREPQLAVDRLGGPRAVGRGIALAEDVAVDGVLSGLSFRVSLRASTPSARPTFPPGIANFAGSSVDALVSMKRSVEVDLRELLFRIWSRTASLFCVKSSKL
jgi:hypothetical protein